MMPEHAASAPIPMYLGRSSPVNAAAAATSGARSQEQASAGEAGTATPLHYMSIVTWNGGATDEIRRHA